MKYFYLLFGLVPALLAGSPALAQISIDEVDAKEDKVCLLYTSDAADE